MNVIRFVHKNSSSSPFDFWRWQSQENANKALQLIFGYLPYATLCTCTKVSKHWRKMALGELEYRCGVTVKTNDEVLYVLQKLHRSSPTRDFRVGKCLIVSSCLDTSLLKQMFRKLGVTLSVLKMKIPHSSKVDLNLVKVLSYLPNLTHVSLVSINSIQSANSWIAPFTAGSSSSVEESCCPASIHNSDKAESKSFAHESLRHLHVDFGQNASFQLSKIFHAFPNLVELSVANIVEEPRKHFKCQRISSSSSTRTLSNIRQFTLRQYSTTGFSEKLVQMLLKFNICLEKLVLIFHPPTQSSSKSLQNGSALVRQFIESQAATLKSLKLVQVEDDISETDPCYCHSNKINATTAQKRRMERRTMTMISYYWNFNYALPSFSLFPMNLPNLEVLHVQKPLITNLAQVLKHFPKHVQLSIQVSPYGSNWKGMFPQHIHPHLTVAVLKLDFIDLESFSRLGVCFPCLHTLQLAYCDDTLFKMLCKFIPHFNKATARARLNSCEYCHDIASDDASLTSLTDEGWMKKNSINSFKNLKLLKVRPCHHFPYENFVYLRGEAGSPCIAEGHNGGFSSDSFDSMAGFSWNDAGILKEPIFVDLPVTSSQTLESCSSA